MAKKGGNFIEEHIEKAVLILAALVCIYPFYKYVITTPNTFKVDGRELRPGEVDIYISERADQLKQQLNRSPEPVDYSDPCKPAFMAKLEGEWSVDTKITWPVPSSVEQKIEKKYRIPVLSQVKDIAAEHIRAAAYVPKGAVTKENVNNQETYEVNDVDFVTVQASIDTGQIAKSFESSFSGSEVPERWRDASLAKPVFGAVQLQRQRLNSNGQWGPWEDVPRIKTDAHREEFSVIDDVNNFPAGGVMIRRLRFGNPDMQSELLQPEPYKIASMEEMWFPPALHRRYLTIQREKEVQERREAITASREEQLQPLEQDRIRLDERDRGRDRGRTEIRTDRDRDSRTRSTREPAGSSISSRSGESSSRGGSRSTTRIARPQRDRRTEPTPDEQPDRSAKAGDETELYNELSKIILADKDIWAMEEPLIFWAHDDTVKPGNSYRYRIRIGVFNPIAKTDQFYPEESSYASKAIFWSDFSDATEAVSIPKRVYFFPINVQEAAKAVEVQVCKYALGYWYSDQFMVKRGETIGKPAKPVTPVSKPKAEEELMTLTLIEQEYTPPEIIDYTTGAVMVDLVAVNDWSGGRNLQPRQYFNMLYSMDGSLIERIAAKLMYWPDELRSRYSEIKSLEKRDKLAFRPWSSGSVLEELNQRSTQMRGTRDRRGRGGEDMRMEDMMRMRMGQPR